MQHRFEAETKATDFHRVLLLDAVLQHTYPCPVLLLKQRVVVRVECRALEVNTESSINHCSTCIDFNKFPLDLGKEFGMAK